MWVDDHTGSKVKGRLNVIVETVSQNLLNFRSDKVSTLRLQNLMSLKNVKKIAKSIYTRAEKYSRNPTTFFKKTKKWVEGQRKMFQTLVKIENIPKSVHSPM